MEEKGEPELVVSSVRMDLGKGESDVRRTAPQRIGPDRAEIRVRGWLARPAVSQSSRAAIAAPSVSAWTAGISSS